jgi:hypothetical protein
MVYNTQNYWVSGLYPSSGILENRKHDVSENECFRFQVKGGEKTPTQLGPLERANLNPEIENASDFVRKDVDVFGTKTVSFNHMSTIYFLIINVWSVLKIN